MHSYTWLDEVKGMEHNMKISFIGTRTMGCKDRINTSILIDDEILFDIGSGTVNQLRNMGKSLGKIRYLFISYYHIDTF